MTSSEPGEHSPNDSLPTIPDQRGLWPLDPTVVHLNHGSYGATPRAAEPVMAALRREKDARPMAWYGGLVERVAAARSEVARWLGAEPDQTALVSNATAAATVVFRSLTFAERDEIVVTDHGYGAVTNAARRAARRSGARLVSVSIPLLATADEVVALVEAAFTARTRVLLIDQITSPTGLLFPVDRLCDLARRHDVLSVIDGAHAPGMLAEPVVAEADVWFGNLHKWACAPRASAALVARPDLAQHLDPVIDSWYADEPYPRRFDMQGTVDMVPWLTAPWVIEHLDQVIGWPLIRDYQAALSQRGTELIAAALSTAVGRDCRVDVALRAPALSLVEVPGLGTERSDLEAFRALTQSLGFEAAGTTFGGRSFVRVSAQVHNTLDDYTAFAERAVPALVEALRP